MATGKSTTGKSATGKSALEKLGQRAAAHQVHVEREILIPLDKVKFDPKQPRKAFHPIDGRIAEKDEAYIQEMAQSIQENGLIQAITVREQGDGTYVVVVGECRTRAHLFLGKPSIRAIVRNDLTNPADLLVYQLAENVTRQDLTDAEMAESIKVLMEGVNGAPSMSQVEIATKLGKSEGWVSRFVKFGDEELQRVWVHSGIADTVEKVYRLSILPKPLQMDILRRIELPEGDPERLEKPLNRNVIDALAQEAKQAKRAESNKQPPSAPATLKGDGADGVGHRPPGVGEGAGSAGADAIDQAMKEAAGLSSGSEDMGGDSKAGSAGPKMDGYELSAEARAALLGGIPEIISDNYGGSVETIEPPVNCRLSVRNLEALLEILREDPTSLDSMRGLRCDVSIPGGLSKQIANRLVGVIVPEQEVPAIVQIELTKLGA